MVNYLCVAFSGLNNQFISRIQHIIIVSHLYNGRYIFIQLFIQQMCFEGLLYASTKEVDIGETHIQYSFDIKEFIMQKGK